MGHAEALERAARVQGELGLSEGVRMVLLAPTFRDAHSPTPLPDVGELRHALATLSNHSTGRGCRVETYAAIGRSEAMVRHTEL